MCFLLHDIYICSILYIFVALYKYILLHNIYILLHIIYIYIYIYIYISALRIKEMIGTVANGKAGLDLHPQRCWYKESTSNRRKMVSEEIHHLEEVRRFATALGQRKQGVWEECKRHSCYME